MVNRSEKTYNSVVVIQRSDYKWGVTDLEDNIIVPFGKYDWIDGFDQGLSRGREKNVSDIPIAHIINALCNILFPGDMFKMTLGQLRQVRNEGEHRCMVIQQEKNEKNSLYKFFKYNTFNTIRIYLIKVVNSIKNNIGKAIVEKETRTKAIISSLLPSACYVKYDDKTKPLPIKLLSKVKGKQNGDIVILIIVNDRIIDIETND